MLPCKKIQGSNVELFEGEVIPFELYGGPHRIAAITRTSAILNATRSTNVVQRFFEARMQPDRKLANTSLRIFLTRKRNILGVSSNTITVMPSSVLLLAVALV